jgi:hypothetical protein
MTSNLSYSAARTPQGATNVFASMTFFFRNGITSSNVFTSPTQGIEGPHGKDDGTDSLESWKPDGGIFNCIWYSCEFECKSIYKVTSHKRQDNLERVPGRHNRSRFTEPCEEHSLHDLSHENYKGKKVD